MTLHHRYARILPSRKMLMVYGWNESTDRSLGFIVVLITRLRFVPPWWKQEFCYCYTTKTTIKHHRRIWRGKNDSYRYGEYRFTKTINIRKIFQTVSARKTIFKVYNAHKVLRSIKMSSLQIRNCYSWLSSTCVFRIRKYSTDLDSIIYYRRVRLSITVFWTNTLSAVIGRSRSAERRFTNAWSTNINVYCDASDNASAKNRLFFCCWISIRFRQDRNTWSSVWS